VDFTREPIIETVVTPKEGCKLVVRSSKAGGHEEYFVDSVEVVSFGNSVFFRSQERPKAFIVPAADYEVLEVREARMVLKNVGLDRSIKIGGGRENNNQKQQKEPVQEKVQPQQPIEIESGVQSMETTTESKPEGRKKDRRKQYRKRRGSVDASVIEGGGEGLENEPRQDCLAQEPRISSSEATGQPSGVMSAFLAPPPMLISETIARYKDNALFKGAFYTKEEIALKTQNTEVVSDTSASLTAPAIPLAPPEYGSFEASEDEEEAIYRERTHQPFLKENDDIQPTTHFGEETFPEKDYSTPHHDERS
jgi:hypothetical protein